MKTLFIGDKFIASSSYVSSLAGRDATTGLSVSTVDWHGEKAEQHAIQQVMEVKGANAFDCPPELLEATQSVQAIGLHFAPIGRQFIESADSLQLIAVARSGLENVDVAAATEHGIAVVPSLGRNAGAVAELQIGLMLAEARNIARAHESVKAGLWRKQFPGSRVEIKGRTVGMIGFGHVGVQFAERLGGFGPRLIAYDPYTSPSVLAAHGVEAVGELNDVFEQSDFIAIQARLTDETERFIGAEQFAVMKPSAYFINVSRSRLVDQNALLETLQTGRISGAGLDVFDDEPLAVDSPWRELDNVTITTHFGGDTEDTNRISADLVVDAIAEFAAEGKIQRAVNARELGWL